MSRYNNRSRVTTQRRNSTGTSPIRTVPAPGGGETYHFHAPHVDCNAYNSRNPMDFRVAPNAVTATGGAAYVNDDRSELFRLGSNLFVNERAFHENADGRRDRFKRLVAGLATYDPQWTLDFLVWLRSEGNIRTASILGAVTAIHARISARCGDSSSTQGRLFGYNRSFAALVPQRLDEVGELFAAYEAEFAVRGRVTFPSALKRGAGDALKRLATEYSVMKWDTPARNYRVADILALTHTSTDDPAQNALFRWAIDSRFGNDRPVPGYMSLLPMITYNERIRKAVLTDPRIMLDPVHLHLGGFTHEDVMGLVGNRLPKGKIWSSLIMSGQMGYTALLSNLRNFEQAGISREAVEKVQRILSDSMRVAKSHVFPFQFWAAYKNTHSALWALYLETALLLSTRYIPEFPGKTLILVDDSISMKHPLSNNSTILRNEAGALFAAAVALRNAGKVDLYAYANSSVNLTSSVHRGGSVLRLVNEIANCNGIGAGTETVKAVRERYDRHDRVIIFTDGQSFPHRPRFSSDDREAHGQTVDSLVPSGVPVYSFDLAGYEVMDIPSGSNNRHQLSGLTDKTFKMIPLLEAGNNADWPWRQRR